MESDRGIFERVCAVLDDATLLNAIVYVSHETVRAGTRIELGDALIDVPWMLGLCLPILSLRPIGGIAALISFCSAKATGVSAKMRKCPPFSNPAECRSACC